MGQIVKSKCELGVAQINIDSAHAGHSGIYTLRIKNGLGDAAASISVKVQSGDAVESQVRLYMDD